VSKVVDIRPVAPADNKEPAPKKPDDSTVAKQLFEPIIITIPKPEAPKKSATDTDKKADGAEPASGSDKDKTSVSDAGDKKSDADKEKVTASETAERKVSTDSEKAPVSDAEDKKAVDNGVDPDKSRRTIIVGNAPKTPEAPTCAITVSQDSISILNNGGSLGVLVRMDGKGELRSIKAVSNSPDDLEIKLEPEIAGVRGQAFYVIRSLTTKTGDFTVAFIAPCGRKEMSVNVR